MIVTSQMQERLEIPECFYSKSRMVLNDDWLYFRGDEVSTIEYMPHGMACKFTIPNETDIVLLKLRTFKPCIDMHYSHNKELDKIVADHDKRQVLKKIKEEKSKYYTARCTLPFYDIAMLTVGEHGDLSWWRPFHGLYTESHSRIIFYHPGNDGFILDDHHI